jgi:hypothetical protein
MTIPSWTLLLELTITFDLLPHQPHSPRLPLQLRPPQLSEEIMTTIDMDKEGKEGLQWTFETIRRVLLQSWI